MSVMGPAGSELNPVFATEGKAWEAAKRYGQEKYFLMAGELWLGGVLGGIICSRIQIAYVLRSLTARRLKTRPPAAKAKIVAISIAQMYEV